MSLRYVSTRGRAPARGFADVLLGGTAPDGGLYVPEHWPRLDPEVLRGFHGRPYTEVAAEVVWPFVEGALERADLDRVVADAYRPFRHRAVAPLVDLGRGEWVQELFWGPTLAFKDVALQLVGRLFEHQLAERDGEVTVLTATSGDTGSAAIEAVRDRDHVRIVVLHPHGRISEVQRKQMTTVRSPNVHNLAVEGTFDDCQALVKALFADMDLAGRVWLSAANSINWARIMAQTVYYVVAAVALGAPDRRVTFSVPTGNFGNVYAAHAARAMGVPVSRLVVASNANDILTRFLASGSMEVREVRPTVSPAMDIQVSSNFERLLYHVLGGDGERVGGLMGDFADTGELRVDDGHLGALREVFDGARLDDDETLAVIADVHASTGYVLDPHTAVGVGAARRCVPDLREPVVTMGTAHPAKFADAVARAIGVRPPLPDHLADLAERAEHYEVVPNDLDAVRAKVREAAGAPAADAGGWRPRHPLP